MTYIPDINVIALIGQTLVNVANTGDVVRFETVDGKTYEMYHNQDCCESVTIESVTGNLDNLIGSPITRADEKIEDMWPADVPVEQYSAESFTWTTFTLATERGTVVIRWYGSSNGYYSESVSFREVR